VISRGSDEWEAGRRPQHVVARAAGRASRRSFQRDRERARRGRSHGVVHHGDEVPGHVAEERAVGAPQNRSRSSRVDARQVPHEVADVRADAVIAPTSDVDRDLHRAEDRGTRYHGRRGAGSAADTSPALFASRSGARSAIPSRGPELLAPRRPRHRTKVAEELREGRGGDHRAQASVSSRPCACGSSGGGCVGTRAGRPGACAMLRPSR